MSALRSPICTAFLAVTTICLAAAAQKPEEFQDRRARLGEQLEPGQVIVLRGRSGRQADLRPSGFRQSDNFFYLTGMTEAGGALVLGRDGQEALYGNAGQRQVIPAIAHRMIFLPRFDTAPKASPRFLHTECPSAA